MASLADVIDRLKDEGQLNRNSGTHSIKSVKDLMSENHKEVVSVLNRIQNTSFKTPPPQEEDSKDTEEKREETKLFKSMLDSLQSTEKSISSLEDGILKSIGTAAKVGLGLGALLLFFDPETLIAGVQGALDFISEGFLAVEALMYGDVAPVIDFIKENIWAVSAAAGLLALKFSLVSNAIGVVSLVVSGVESVVNLAGAAATKLKTAFTAVRAVMLALHASVIATLAPLATAIAPVLLIVAGIVAIGALFYALVESIDDARAEFEETNSLWEAVKTGLNSLISYIIGLPLEFFGGITAWVARMFGFDSFAQSVEDFDYVEACKTFFSDVYNWVVGIFTFETLSTVLTSLNPFGVITALFANVYNWVTSKFDKESMIAALEEFNPLDVIKAGIQKMSDWFTDVFNAASKWFKEKFDWIPGIGGGDSTEDKIAEEKEKMDKAVSAKIEEERKLAEINADIAMKAQELAAEKARLQQTPEEQPWYSLLDDKSDVNKSIEELTEQLKELSEKGVNARARISTYDEQAAAAANRMGQLQLEATGATTDNAGKAMQYFMDQGWTKEQAAGIVGNLQAESGMNLDTQAVGDGGKAVGIAQWHPDRQANFEKVFGKTLQEATLEEQLEFVNWELNNTEKRAGDKIRSANTAQGAAYMTDKYYERSSGAHRAKRMELASNLANMEGVTDQSLQIAQAENNSLQKTGEPMVIVAPSSGGGSGGQSTSSSTIINQSPAYQDEILRRLVVNPLPAV